MENLLKHKLEKMLIFDQKISKSPLDDIICYIFLNSYSMSHTYTRVLMYSYLQTYCESLNKKTMGIFSRFINEVF